jgi:hypothetical protein
MNRTVPACDAQFGSNLIDWGSQAVVQGKNRLLKAQLAEKIGVDPL